MGYVYVLDKGYFLSSCCTSYEIQTRRSGGFSLENKRIAAAMQLSGFNLLLILQEWYRTLFSNCKPTDNKLAFLSHVL